MSEHEKKLTVPIKIEYDHIQGPVTAPISLVEYGDFECPYTRQAYPIVKEIKRKLGDTLCFAFRNFPLKEIHPHAQHAAEAAEAAAFQGKFWEMHDHLFEHQNALDDNHLLKYAQAVGLDIKKFESQLFKHIYAPTINDSLINGFKSGVEGTPTFFLNGTRYEGSWDLETLLKKLTDSHRK
jgi:protein-disulfide isomerase